MPSLRKTITFLVIAITVILIDQYTKYYILSSITWSESYHVTSFLSLVVAFNKGVSFGMMTGQQQEILIFLSGLVIILLLYMLNKSTIKYSHITTALIVGGAIGNIIDRITHGAVVDFIDFHYLGYHFPAFNIADTSICCGVALMIYLEFRKD